MSFCHYFLRYVIPTVYYPNFSCHVEKPTTSLTPFPKRKGGKLKVSLLREERFREKFSRYCEESNIISALIKNKPLPRPACFAMLRFRCVRHFHSVLCHQAEIVAVENHSAIWLFDAEAWQFPLCQKQLLGDGDTLLQHPIV